MTENTLIGAKAIAEFLWGDARHFRRVYYYMEQPGRIPLERDIWSGRLTGNTAQLAAWRQTLQARIKAG